MSARNASSPAARIRASVPLRDHVAALPVVAAVDEHEELRPRRPGRHRPPGRRRAAAAGTTTRRSGRRTSGAADRPTPAPPSRGRRGHHQRSGQLVDRRRPGRGSARRSPGPRPGAGRPPPRARSRKVGSSAAGVGEQVEEVPLRDERDVLVRAGQPAADRRSARCRCRSWSVTRSSSRCGIAANRSPRPSSSSRVSVEACTVSPRKSRRKSPCFSSTVTCDAGPGQQQPEDHPGRAAADDEQVVLSIAAPFRSSFNFC